VQRFQTGHFILLEDEELKSLVTLTGSVKLMRYHLAEFSLVPGETWATRMAQKKLAAWISTIFL